MKTVELRPATLEGAVGQDLGYLGRGGLVRVDTNEQPDYVLRIDQSI